MGSASTTGAGATGRVSKGGGGLGSWAQALMLQGAPLATQVPGRAGWELRLVVQGGLRILEKIARMDHAALTQRPTISAWDGPLLLWRALRKTGAQ